MWKPLQKSPPYFVMLMKESINFFHIGVTDYHRYWISYTSRNNFLTDLKEANEGVEFEDWNVLVNIGLDMLKNPDTLKKVSILEGAGHLNILMWKDNVFPLKLELGLLEASSAQFFKIVIQPLLKTVCDLHSSQEELRELLQLKDKEIEKYRSDGFVPKRSLLPVYDDAAHIAKHNTYKSNFGAPGMQDLLLELSNAEVEADIKSTPESGSVSVAEQKEPVTSAISTEVQPTGIVELPEISHKIEKCSQSTLIDEIAPIVPVQIDESNVKSITMNSNKRTVEVKTDSETESKSPLRRKRRQNCLNY